MHLAELFSELATAEDRPSAARQLAWKLGAHDAIVFTRDPELGTPLPSLGFPQTLPSTQRWRDLLNEAFEAGVARAEVVLPGSGAPITAHAIADGAALVLWPQATFERTELCPYLRLLNAVFSPERHQQILEGQLAVATTSAREVQSLATLLDQSRKQLEQRVQERTAELRASIRELEGFTYSVSHDLRAPLRAIIASSKILEEDYGKFLPEPALDLLRVQAQRALRLGNLIDDLLKLSRISQAEIRRCTVDLSAAAIEQIQALSKNRLHDAPEIKFKVEPNLWGHADPALVRLVLQNLIENAIKFSPRGGEIVFGEQHGVLYLRDHGVGFDMKYAKKIFMPFERLVTEAQFPGTGIGLANVQRIIDRHGGRIWFESAPNVGTTFYFTLEQRASVR